MRAVGVGMHILGHADGAMPEGRGREGFCHLAAGKRRALRGQRATRSSQALRASSLLSFLDCFALQKAGGNRSMHTLAFAC